MSETVCLVWKVAQQHRLPGEEKAPEMSACEASRLRLDSRTAVGRPGGTIAKKGFSIASGSASRSAPCPSKTGHASRICPASPMRGFSAVQPLVRLAARHHAVRLMEDTVSPWSGRPAPQGFPDGG